MSCADPTPTQIWAIMNDKMPQRNRFGESKRLMMLALGPMLIVLAPAVGVIPGPGGVIVLVAGIALTLQGSRMAKRVYVRVKRRWPRLGYWSDKGLRRPSHFRRLRKAKDGGG